MKRSDVQVGDVLRIIVLGEDVHVRVTWMKAGRPRCHVVPLSDGPVGSGIVKGQSSEQPFALLLPIKKT